MDFETLKEKIRDTKRNTKIRKKIAVYTLKAGSVTKRALTRRKAVVLAKHPRFVHVRLIGEGGHYGSEERMGMTKKQKMIRFEIPGEPMGKQRPRVVRVGGFSGAYTPKKTADYEDAVRLAFKQAANGLWCVRDGAVGMKVTAYYKIPKSTSKVKAKDMIAELIRPAKKPDVDNVAKAVMDALNGVAYKDDAAIVFLQVAKYYAVIPRVEVVLWEEN